MACVNILSFHLQILLREHGDWAKHPVAVVSDTASLGKVLELNEQARRAGVQKGDTYAGALSLCPSLRGGVVSIQKAEEHMGRVCDALDKFSPALEPSSFEQGIVWMDCNGLGRVFKSVGTYIGEVLGSLEQLGFHAGVCVGFSRFGTYALVNGGEQKVVSKSPEDEFVRTRRVQLSALGIDYLNLEALHKLGVYTVGDLLRLPADGLRSRFKQRVHEIHKMATNDIFNPIIPRIKKNNPVATAELEFPDDDSNRLLFVIKKLIGNLLSELACGHEAAQRLSMVLTLEYGPKIETNIIPAEPTLDVKGLLTLFRLKLESLSLESKVEQINIEAHPVAATSSQLVLFAFSEGRDLEAASEELARIKAKFGECVAVAQMEEGHLPEAQYSFRSLDKLAPSRPAMGEHVLQRRVYRRAVSLNSKPVRGPAGVHLGGLDGEPVKQMTGPYTVSGGWWLKEVHRDYYFAETDKNDVMWVYFDRKRRRWFLQGHVE